MKCGSQYDFWRLEYRSIFGLQRHTWLPNLFKLFWGNGADFWTKCANFHVMSWAEMIWDVGFIVFQPIVFVNGWCFVSRSQMRSVVASAAWTTPGAAIALLFTPGQGDLLTFDDLLCQWLLQACIYTEIASTEITLLTRLQGQLSHKSVTGLI